MEGADRKAKSASDLGVRTMSAVIMIGVAGTALWLGGWFWAAFVGLVALGVLWEWASLSFAISKPVLSRLVWILVGLSYVSIGSWILVTARLPYDGIYYVSLLVLTVIGVDVGAYAAGRSIGGPKIAPLISPSKTWAGLFGGALGGGIVLAALQWAWPAGLCETYINYMDGPASPGKFGFDDRCHLAGPSVAGLLQYVAFGLPIAIVAQSGDFFESWMKRRAGVKDSGRLIPGHGGLFDRVDGLLAICFILGLVWGAVSFMR